MHTTSSIQAGATLLVAAMRDPAPIMNLSTFWDFMKVVEACGSQLTDAEKASPLYQEHVACYDRIFWWQNDVSEVGEKWIRLGPQLIEAFAAYAEQAASLLTFLLDHRPATHLASLLQEFEQVLQHVEQEIREVPGSPLVQDALAAFEQCNER